MMVRKYIFFLLFVFSTCSVHAQLDGTSSTYSRFGVGTLFDQCQTYNRSMGGVAQGLRAGNRINKQNPASYSAVDSLTFLFDAGMSLARTYLSTNTSAVNIFNAYLDYVNAECRLAKHLGLSFGFMPVSNVGYYFSQSYDVMQDTYYNQTITQTITYAGSGGLREFYVGAGWSPFKNFSFGANVSFLWGDFTHSVFQSFYEDGTVNTTNYSSMNSLYNTEIRNWRCDMGLQYEIPLKKDKSNTLTLGATVGFGHKIPGSSDLLRYTLNADTVVRTAQDAYQLPMIYSGGFALKLMNILTVAADFAYEQWGKCTLPQIDESQTGTLSYVPTKGLMKDRMKYNFGMELIPSKYDRNYFKRINYRIGFHYYSPYQIINGEDGPDEWSVSAGFGFPTVNNRSYVNLGLQWIRRSANFSNAILENCYMINIGLTFNERWFMKFKFE